MTYTPEMLAMLERQRAYFSSDDHLRREAEPWVDSTPAERIAEVASMCRAAEHFLDLAEAEGRLPRHPVSVEERFPADTLALFRALRSQGL
jgi:hypothetical protein